MERYMQTAKCSPFLAIPIFPPALKPTDLSMTCCNASLTAPAKAQIGREALQQVMDKSVGFNAGGKTYGFIHDLLQRFSYRSG